MLLASAEYHLPLGECVSLLSQLHALGTGLPPVPELDETLVRERFTPVEAALLVGEVDPDRVLVNHWQPAEVSIAHLKQYLPVMGEGASTAEELLSRLRRMAPWASLCWETTAQREPRTTA